MGEDDDSLLPEEPHEFRSLLKGQDRKTQKRKRRRSIKQEDRIAKEVGGRRVPGSGNAAVLKGHNTRGKTGDVTTKEFKIEAKYTDKKSFRITEDVILKAFVEASTEGMDWLLQVDIYGFDTSAPNKLAVLDWEVFLELLRRSRGEDVG